MQHLAEWRALLEAELRSRQSAAVVEQRDAWLEVLVWSLPDVQTVWSVVDEIGMPQGAVRVIRPISYLLPYPGDDARNDAAFEAFLERNVRTGDNGKQFLLSGLDPIVGPEARVLVLGSMPGALSLERGEYYAHPRNRFWKVVDRVLRVPSSGGYDQRIGAVADAGVALWDVLRHCTRIGSLDRDIDPCSEVPNEIVPFLRSNPTIGRIVFNGRKAEQSFRRWIGEHCGGIDLIAAPSTSPANTRVSMDELTESWRAALL